MATWGVKVTDELKEKIANAMKESGLEGQDFVDQLYTLYATEIFKKEKPQFAKELEELQKLTQRVYNIYLNSAEQTDNLLQSKEDSFQIVLQDLQVQIGSQKNELHNKENELEALRDAYNNLSDDKNEVDIRISELVDTITTKQELVIEYKEKNDTLAGLVTEYKTYKEVNKEITASLQSATTELGDTKLSLKESQAVIGFKEQEIERINKNNEETLIIKGANYNKEIENIIKQHDQELISIKEKAELNTGKALLEGDQKHQKIIGEITEKFNSKLETITDKLESEREINSKLKEENFNLKVIKKEPGTKTSK